MPDGTSVYLYTLRNTQNMEVRISDYGGIITHWIAPDNKGRYEDIVLGYDSLDGYLKATPYFGAIVGRYGNRISKGKFILDGQTYHLATNNGENHLHGGLRGFDKVLWTATTVDSEIPTLKLSYLSKDGEEGYPGNLQVEVIYSLQEDNSLKIDYQATTDKTTIVNLTNHTYFNLSGDVKGDILNHEITLNADYFLPVDSTLIPTGELKSVKGSAFDFLQNKPIGKGINDTENEQIRYGKGYDHSWVLNPSKEKSAMNFVATVLEPISGRVLEVFTMEPATQFYTGNFLDGTIIGKKGIAYKKRYGFCLETQHYPDSPNQKNFPSTVLKPNEVYKTSTIYKLSVKQ
ncbi:MAG: galactose mutarotase [Thermoflexibacter sp.]|nr:galactose mutarotase [Thermoflexibacter sp.]